MLLSRPKERWRDPDSNRGHHDFQGRDGSLVGAGKVLQIGQPRVGRAARPYLRFPVVAAGLRTWRDPHVLFALIQETLRADRVYRPYGRRLALVALAKSCAMFSMVRKSSISRDSSSISVPNRNSISSRNVTSPSESSSAASMRSVWGAGAETSKVSSKPRWMRAVISCSVIPWRLREPCLEQTAVGCHDSPSRARALRRKL